MRFTRHFKGNYQETDRKRAAAVCRQRREIASMPLFAREVAESLPSYWKTPLAMPRLADRSRNTA